MLRRMMRGCVVACVLAIAAAPVHAGGLWLPVQGVHSLERAGALVAGASDADALWLDPAGLGSFAKQGQVGLSFDVAYLYQPVTYAGGSASIRNEQPGEELPSLAGAVGIDDHWVVGGGFTFKYAPTSAYEVGATSPSGPERYASTGVHGTEYVEIAVGAAYAITPALRVGATVQDLVTLLDLRVSASACPGTMTCSTSYDLPLELKGTDAFAPSGSLGVQYDVRRELTLGLVAQAPSWISKTVGLHAGTPMALAAMPPAGDAAHVQFWLPPSVRAGAEYHDGRVALEAAVDVELWELQKAIAIAPQLTLGATSAHAVDIARDLRPSVAVSLGGEVQLGVVRLGAGIGYETAATRSADVSVLSVDGQKWLFGLGGGYAHEGWQIAVAASFVYQPDITVADPAVAQLAPFRDASAPPSYVNAGTYHAFDVMAGLRLARRF